MSTIFISHSSQDNEAAKELERRLAQQNHASVFLDLDPEKGIVAGQSWERTLYRKLRACRAVIALCTDSYLRSHWCFAEIALARMEGKHIFAIKTSALSDQAKMPAILTEKQFIDIRTDQEEGYQRLWRGLNETDLLGMTAEWNPKDSPYLGLSAFQEKHAPVFFGREQEARAGVELLERGAPGLIMMLGASGSGKSSLVRAGVLPRLRRNPDQWLIIDPFRPGHNPFHELAESLVQTYRRYAPEYAARIGGEKHLSNRLQAWSPDYAGRVENQGVGDAVTDDARVRRLIGQLEELHQQPPTSAEGSFMNFLDWSLDDLRRICDSSGSAVSEYLYSGTTPLIDITRDLLRVSERRNARVLMIIDQFEELFGADEDDGNANDFLRFLRASIEAEDSPVMLLGTMRSDFLETFQRNPILRGIDFESLSLGSMKPEGMRKVIEEPAKLSAIELEKGLVDRLIEDTETPDALPLLSFTLWVLWRDYRDNGKLEIRDYENLDGLHGAVAREADALLKASDEDILRNAFLCMAKLTDQGNYARQAVAWDSEELRPVHSQLDRFVERRLLVTRAEGGTRMVEVAHEALFRSWAPLKTWLDNGRAELLLKQQISQDATSWIENGRDKDRLWRGSRLQQANELLDNRKLQGEQKEFIQTGVRRRRTQRRMLASTAIGLFLGMAGLTVFALYEQTIAEDAKNSAEQQKQKAVRQALYARQAEDRAESHREVAEILKARAEKAAATAEAAKAQLRNEYVQIIHTLGELFIEDFLGKDSEDFQSGVLTVDEEKLEIQRSRSNSKLGKLLVMGRYGKGSIVAATHDVLFSEKRPNSAIFLDKAIKWAIRDPSRATNILYSVGHCETVAKSEKLPRHRLPSAAIKKSGYSIEHIKDLTNTKKLNTDTAAVLIVGNAWAEFTAAEIEAVNRFVTDGGGLLLAGLKWYWESSRDDGFVFNPCILNTHSASLLPAKQSYPMNDLAKQFGIQWSTLKIDSFKE